jgi:hypothetical protein
VLDLEEAMPLGIRANPNSQFQVTAWKTPQEIDPIITDKISRGQQVEIADMRRIVLFRPQLDVLFYTKIAYNDKMIIFKYALYKNGGEVWNNIGVDQFVSHRFFVHPSELPNMHNFRSGNLLLGNWTMTVSYTWQQARILQEQGSKLKTFLAKSAFETLGRVNWKVVDSQLVRVELTSTGERVDPFNPNQYNDGRVYSADEI